MAPILKNIKNAQYFKMPSGDELNGMLTDFITSTKEAVPKDHETLCESILFQFAYLETLIESCRQEKNPEGEIARLIKGKDQQHNR